MAREVKIVNVERLKFTSNVGELLFSFSSEARLEKFERLFEEKANAFQTRLCRALGYGRLSAASEEILAVLVYSEIQYDFKLILKSGKSFSPCFNIGMENLYEVAKERQNKN